LKNINLADYTYDLPQDRIATYGLKQRDQSKLLYYKKDIRHHHFYELPDLLPEDSTLFFNNTKVIQARLILKRDSGAIIEVFLLNPVKAHEEIFDSLESTEPVLYHCMIGNLKKWREGEKLREKVSAKGKEFWLTAELVSKEERFVEFSWDSPKITFSDILETIGHTPLPPYINRPDEAEDKERYQTVYSKNPGAVAAPTAGLHFTKEILAKLENKQHKTDFLTLHVSAGTFQPIKVDKIIDHPMHEEQVILSLSNLQAVIEAKTIIPVGTTAMRTLESTYWFGVKLLENPQAHFHIEKLYPYENHSALPTRQVAFQAVAEHMEHQAQTHLRGDTEIFIFPGYDFKVCDALITNFHQPGSTLILLVAAFIGADWQKVYEQALNNDYRFLSYGDSSLLFR
jgi:S-adenosylmethionine:tRNA ribosyltransferase-isomerase